MHSAKAAANYFLGRAFAEKVPVDHMKLQKLLYYAHGWYLALKGQPLMNEPVEAWWYGPVFPSVYHEFKRYGTDPIQLPAFELKGKVPEPIPPVANEEATQVLDRVWDVYKEYSGIQLSNMTHRPGTPWSVTRERNPGRSYGVDIPNDEIAKYFRQVALRNKRDAED